MTAGAVAVPTIMPLRAPIPGQHKSTIDTNTKIELRSGMETYAIYIRLLKVLSHYWLVIMTLLKYRFTTIENTKPIILICMCFIYM